MGIFNKTLDKAPSKIPLLEEFSIQEESYDILRNIESDAYEVSLGLKRSTYIGLKEQNVEILEEGLSDFFKNAAEFFRKLAHKILEFAKNTMKLFVSYFQDFDKFLTKNREYLKSLDINFSYSGYEYNFPEAPVVSKAYDIISSYNADISRIDNLKYADVSKMKEEYSDYSYKNKIRASILGVSAAEVSQDSFTETSRLIFRGSKEKINININKAYIDKILTEYSTMKTLLNKTENQKTKIVKMLNDLEVFFQRKASVVFEKEEKKIQAYNISKSDDDKLSYDSHNTTGYDDKKLTTLNLYFDLKYQESKFISNCIVTVYLDKINAIRDCMKQYRDIIRKALDNTKKPTRTESGGANK